MSLPLPTPAIHAPFLKEVRTVYQGNYYTAEQMQAYGQACRAAALEEVDKREPLSEPQLFVIWHALPDDDGAFPDFVDAARAVEQAHHITEKALKP